MRHENEPLSRNPMLPDRGTRLALQDEGAANCETRDPHAVRPRTPGDRPGIGE